MTTLPTELVKRLRGRSPKNYRTRSRSHRLDDKAAADLIEAQAAEISSLRAKLAEAMESRDKQMDYAIDLQRIIEDLCDGRPIREPKTTARHHFNMAVEFQRAARRLVEENGK